MELSRNENRYKERCFGRLISQQKGLETCVEREDSVWLQTESGSDSDRRDFVFVAEHCLVFLVMMVLPRSIVDYEFTSSKLFPLCCSEIGSGCTRFTGSHFSRQSRTSVAPK